MMNKIIIFTLFIVFIALQFLAYKTLHNKMNTIRNYDYTPGNFENEKKDVDFELESPEGSG